MPDPTPEPAFVRRLRKLVETGAGLPFASARRQHYVPSFLLARWATPQNRHGKLAALHIPTGHAAMAKPGKVAYARDLYTLHTGSGGVDLQIESFMGVIENEVAEPLKQLGAVPLAISDEDRWTIAFFLALQQGRTPPGLAEHRQFAERAGREVLRARRARLDDFDAVATAYRRHIDPNAKEDVIRAFAEAQKQAIPDPDGPLQTTPEAPFQSLASNVSRIAMTVAGTDWTLLTTEREFIQNDRGLAMWDPDLPATRGNMWMSSPAAETTVPIAPHVCLKLAPGKSGYAIASADSEEVDTINLRTYGWATERVFGTTTKIVRAVHMNAKANPASVPRPVVPKIHDARVAPG